MKLCGNDSGGRLKRNFFTCISDFLDETGKTTRAIAAHFCFAAVAIIVTHPKISTVGRALDQQNPIRPNPAMTIANFRDLLRAQLHVAGAIVDHDKIVPRPVHLGESQHVIRVPQGCLNANRSSTVIPSEVEGSRGVTLKLSHRDPSAFARDDELTAFARFADC